MSILLFAAFLFSLFAALGWSTGRINSIGAALACYFLYLLLPQVRTLFHP